MHNNLRNGDGRCHQDALVLICHPKVCLLGTPVTVNITLEIAKANTQLSVTSEAPLVQAQSTAVVMRHTSADEL